MPNRGLTLTWMLGGALLMAGCGDSSSQVDECSSALRIDLDIVNNVVIDVESPEVVINEVLWEISGPTLDEPKKGKIDTSDPKATASVEVYGLLPGNYEIDLEADSKDGETTCRGSASFDVKVGVATELAVLLRCSPGKHFGKLDADGWFNVCTELTWAIVAPLQTSIGNAIIVSSVAEDDEGHDIEYSWTALNGSLLDPSAAATIYTCEKTGSDTITISVSDDGSDYCVDSWSVPVECVEDNGTGGTGGGATGGSGGSGTGGAGGNGTGGVGGNGTGGTGGGATGGVGGNGTGGTGGNGTGGTGGGVTGGVGGNGTGTGGTDGNPECIVSLTVN
ncbi:MAG: hypothetical protein OEQ49_12745 [Myxococcales bacterium]|nr:hypothetical protein [Myxococcales bacterium]